MTPTNWRPPRTDKEVRVRFRNGIVSKEALLPSKWNWRNRDYDWDILEWTEA